MSNKDPFAEPDDNERTVIRPNPGGKRPTPGVAPQSHAPTDYGQRPADPGPAMGVPASSARPSGGAEAHAIAMTGMNPLTALATPLLSLVSRIRNRAQHMDPDKLRQSVMAEVRGFEMRRCRRGKMRKRSRSRAMPCAPQSTMWC